MNDPSAKLRCKHGANSKGHFAFSALHNDFDGTSVQRMVQIAGMGGCCPTMATRTPDCRDGGLLPCISLPMDMARLQGWGGYYPASHFPETGPDCRGGYCPASAAFLPLSPLLQSTHTTYHCVKFRDITGDHAMQIAEGVPSEVGAPIFPGRAAW